jgi:alkylhydroperoxidase family enzyme
MTTGLQTAGGIARAGQAFAVNGEPPEMNNYLLDGASNVDRSMADMPSAFRSTPLLSSAFSLSTHLPNTARQAAPQPQSSQNRVPTPFTAISTTSSATAPSTPAISSQSLPIPSIATSTAPHSAGPSAKEKALLRLTAKITGQLPGLTSDDIDQVRSHSWDDEAIYYAITTCALFNFYNRWITATGVPEMSEAAHRLQGKHLAERGYIREEKK